MHTNSTHPGSHRKNPRAEQNRLRLEGSENRSKFIRFIIIVYFLGAFISDPPLRFVDPSAILNDPRVIYAVAALVVFVGAAMISKVTGPTRKL